MSTRADRDLSHLQPYTREKVEKILKEVGDLIFITEGYRTKARQVYLYSLGRTRPGNVVTMTLDSKHMKGIAVDIAFHGKELYPSRSNSVWNKVADVFKKHGMDWGGDWTKFKDYPHFEDNKPDFTTNDDTMDANVIAIIDESSLNALKAIEKNN